jgi:predicted transcriptional regulator
MDVQFLQDIGLTNVQATAYKALIEHGTQTAPALARAIGESRSNGYKVLDKLVELGLAIRTDIAGKFHYSATSPAALEQFVKQQVETIHQKERRLKSELPRLLDYYFAHSERPSIRYFEGREGIVGIYKDQLGTGRPIHYVRTLADLAFIQFDDLHHLRNLYPKFGVQRYAIIPDSGPGKILPPDQQMSVAESDKHMLLQRTWVHESDYSAPVEWAAYGNKLSIIQYGEEAMGMVIESKPIADAFRQLFGLLDEGIRRRPEYDNMPLKTTYTAIPESLRQSHTP